MLVYYSSATIVLYILYYSINSAIVLLCISLDYFYYSRRTST